MARGFVNNLAMEPVDEKALEEQGVPPFIANKHFVDRHRANLMSKHPDFYKVMNDAVNNAVALTIDHHSSLCAAIRMGR